MCQSSAISCIVLLLLRRLRRRISKRQRRCFIGALLRAILKFIHFILQSMDGSLHILSFACHKFLQRRQQGTNRFHLHIERNRLIHVAVLVGEEFMGIHQWLVAFAASKMKLGAIDRVMLLIEQQVHNLAHFVHQHTGMVATHIAIAEVIFFFLLRLQSFEYRVQTKFRHHDEKLIIDVIECCFTAAFVFGGSETFVFLYPFRHAGRLKHIAARF
mmetsp:Transcript_32230/g.52151  ORF Transcript_32230/g.52151 Transcript_32230/m.52151 type:complete len:215 (-) Transcript_32230:311-955(-)